MILHIAQNETTKHICSYMEHKNNLIYRIVWLILTVVSWDLFFGACHFCSITLANLAVYFIKWPKMYFKVL